MKFQIKKLISLFKMERIESIIDELDNVMTIVHSIRDNIIRLLHELESQSNGFLEQGVRSYQENDRNYRSSTSDNTSEARSHSISGEGRESESESDDLDHNYEVSDSGSSYSGSG